MLRRLLVGSAHYILGPFGEDCDSASLWIEAGGPMWKERQAKSGGGGGAEARRAAAQAVGNCGSV